MCGWEGKCVRVGGIRSWWRGGWLWFAAVRETAKILSGEARIVWEKKALRAGLALDAAMPAGVARLTKA